jgi:hypothetical protein
MLPWMIPDLQIPLVPLVIVVVICGVVGGSINVSGRGPLWAGAICGLLMGLGGFGAVVWWLQGRESVYKIEIVLAFGVGALPGFFTQFLIQYILRKRGLME